MLKCGHNRKITPLCTGFVHRSRDFTSSTVFYPTRGNAVAFGLFGGCAKALSYERQHSLMYRFCTPRSQINFQHSALSHPLSASHELLLGDVLYGVLLLCGSYYLNFILLNSVITVITSNLPSTITNDKMNFMNGLKLA